MSAHEPLNKEETLRPGSDRAFGWVFSMVFLIIGSWPLMSGEALRWWSIGLSLVFAIMAIALPSKLHPLNILWTRFGLLLNRVISPIILGAVFFLVVTPIGLGFKVLRKDPLRLKWDSTAQSYWLERDPPGPDPETMSNQF